MYRAQKQVGDPMSESGWTSVLHISVMLESLWNFPQDGHTVESFMYWTQSRSNDFRMHVYGDGSN